MKIGIFDSGIGGVSVLHEALHRLPNEEYIFYADVNHVPYGKKEPEEIQGFADDIMQFMIQKGVDAVVIACNTATSVAVPFLREKYKNLPIIGMEPAVKPAVKMRGKDRVLVMATPVTIRENKLHDLLQKVDTEHSCDLLPMPELVTFAEKENFSDPAILDYLKKQSASLPHPISEYSVVVLGCTHFNYFKPQYRQMFSEDTNFIDGNAGTIRHLADVLGLTLTDEVKAVRKETSQACAAVNEEKVSYYFSGRPVEDEKELQIFKHLHERLEEVRSF